MFESFGKKMRFLVHNHLPTICGMNITMDVSGRLGNLIGAMFVDPDPMARHNFLVEKGIIPAVGTYMCPNCNAPLKLWKNSDSPDGYQWHCNAKVSVPKRKRRICGTRVSYRKGTFLERARLSTGTVIFFAFEWCNQISLANISKNLGISEVTCVDWASFCREVVFDAMILRREPLGGPGKVVEIDESKFGRREYHREHRFEGQWVFGGYERDSGKVFLVPVENRDRSTLVPLIQEWVRPGTTIISDCWEAYQGMEDLGYKHLTVNHSISLENSVTGAHTNSIKTIWRSAKSFLATPGQHKKLHVPGNLARYMFHKRCKDLGLDVFTEFLRCAGEIYDPRRSRDATPFPGVSSSSAAGPTDVACGGDTATPSTSSAPSPPIATGSAASIATAEEDGTDSDDIELFN